MYRYNSGAGCPGPVAGKDKAFSKAFLPAPDPRPLSLMSPVLRILKRIVLWSYGRTTWQYDVLCVLILAFVFLTPKSWFDNGKPTWGAPHQNSSVGAQKLLLKAENLGQNPDRQEIERGARVATGRDGARVKGFRELRDAGGRIAYYEVDIE